MKTTIPGSSLRPVAIATTSLLTLLGGVSALAQDRMLEEVLVSAQKKTESVQDIPATVNAISGETLDNFQILDFSETAELIPGLELTTVDARRSTITLRGIQFDPVNTATSPINVYWNGTPIRPNIAFQPVYDLQRMEVLRGPQGTLQGRTSPAGQINIVTRRANVSQFDGYVRQTFQDNAGSNTQFGASLPLIKDTLAIRLAGLYDDNEGQQGENLNTGQQDSYLSRGGRVTLDWFAGDSFDASLVYDYRKTNTVVLDTVDGIPVTTGTGPVIWTGVVKPYDREDREAIARAPYDNDANSQLISLAMDWDIGDLTLSSVSGYQDNENNGLSDSFKTSNNVGADVPLTSFSTPQEVLGSSYVFSQELRLANNNANFWQYIVGLYYDKTHTLNQAIVDIPFVTPATASPCGYRGSCTFLSDIPVDQELAAAFMHNTLNFTENTNLQFGLRYQHNSYRSAVNRFADGAALGDALAGQDNISENALTGSLKISHFFANDIMVYGSYDRGYRPPGITITPTVLPGDLLPFDDETSDSLEIGFKSTLADGVFRLNGSIFYQTFDGYQAHAGDIFWKSAPGGQQKILGGLTYNADAIVQGVELEFTHLLGERFSWGGGASYTDSRFKDGETGPCNDPTQLAGLPVGSVANCDIGGDQIAAVPYFSTVLHGDYYVPFGSTQWYVRGLWTYQSNITNEFVDGKEIPSYSVVNLYTGFRAASMAWDLSLWAKNLLDTQEQSQLRNNQTLGPLDLGVAVAPMIPQRVVGVTFQYNWGI